MKAIRIIFHIFYLFSVGYTVSCSPIYGVKYDYNEHTNFADLKTYDWALVPVEPGIDRLFVQHIKNAVNFELQTKGLITTSTNPNLLIAQHFDINTKVQINNWGYEGPGPHADILGEHWGPGRASTYNYKEISIILDFVDAESKRLIWRGTAKSKFKYSDNPEENWKLIKAAVKKILKKYPPSSK